MGKYKLTNEILLINNSGTALYRIEATEDFGDVLSGDSGGWVQNKKNLSDDGWIYDNAKVYGNGLVSGSAKMFNNSVVCDSSAINGYAELHDNVILGGKTKVGGTAKLYTDIFLDSKIEIIADSWSGVTYFVGSRHIVWQNSKNNIRIGCLYGKINYWVENVRIVAEENGYSQQEIDEYEGYVQHIANLYT